MTRCPSQDWDDHCHQEDRFAHYAWMEQHKPIDGLFSGFSVFETEYIEHPWNEETGVETEVKQHPLEMGCFVLVPFNEDGSIRDHAAIEALRRYAEIKDGRVADEIDGWLTDPKKYEWLNQPWE